jgi:hypothetical protein
VLTNEIGRRQNWGIGRREKVEHVMGKRRNDCISSVVMILLASLMLTISLSTRC